MIYIGGIYNEGFPGGLVACGRPRSVQRAQVDYNKLWKAQGGFYDPAINGLKGSLWMDPDMSKVVVPQWIEMPTTHNRNIHQRGTSEQFIRSATPLKDKKLILAKSGWMADAYARVAEHRAFFDYWLKGIKNGVMDEPPVRAYIRTGNGGGYYQHFDNWPAPETQYTKLYLDASPSNWAGDRQRKDFLRLSQIFLERGDITEREREMLRLLCASPGDSVSREVLSGLGGAAQERTVDVLINRLRRKIGAGSR